MNFLPVWKKGHVYSIAYRSKKIKCLKKDVGFVEKGKNNSISNIFWNKFLLIWDQTIMNKIKKVFLFVTKIYLKKIKGCCWLKFVGQNMISSAFFLNSVSAS